MTHAAPATVDPGDIFSRSFTVYKENFALIFPIALALYAIPALLALALGASLISALVVTLLTFVAAVLLGGALVQLVRDYQDGTLDSSPGQLIQSVVPVFLPLILAGLVAGIIVVVGFIFFIIPGVLAAIALAVVAPVVVLENPGVFKSLGRSKDLTSGHWGKIFLLWLLYVAIAIATGIVGGILGAIIGDAGSAVANWIVNALLQPLWGIVVATLYLGLRAANGEPPVGAGAAGQPQQFAQPGYQQAPPQGYQQAPPQGYPQQQPPQPPAPQPGYQQQPPAGGEPPKQL